MIELMIVVAIMAVILSIGLPAAFGALKKKPLRQAVADYVEGCSQARAMAIIKGSPYDFVISGGGVSVSVQAGIGVSSTPKPSSGSSDLSYFEENSTTSRSGSRRLFSANIHEDVGIQFIDVNHEDQMQYNHTRVRFYPNGTCDEFTVILYWVVEGKRKMIQLNPITGLADVNELP